MTATVALLRAVNVGGTGLLAMSDLKALCERLGFDDVRTVLQSGNVVFRNPLSRSSAQARLAKALAATMKAPVTVVLRTPAELRSTLENNPFPKAETSRVIVFFSEDPPDRAALEGLVIPGNEEVRLQGRDLYVHYPDGQGRSKLKLPGAKTATGRNLNTVAKLLEAAEELR
jgi:uncharacterized protein (DUF1697 family)